MGHRSAGAPATTGRPRSSRCRRATGPGPRRRGGSSGGAGPGDPGTTKRSSCVRFRHGACDVDVRPSVTAVDLLDASGEPVTTGLRLSDHRAKAGDLRLEGLDLAIDPSDAVERQGAAFDRVLRGLEPGPVASPSRFVLEELADLSKAEPGVIA